MPNAIIRVIRVIRDNPRFRKVAPTNTRVLQNEQFHKEYENVADFEQKYEIKLPEDLAALLTFP